jgi:hypothetical protein
MHRRGTTFTILLLIAVLASAPAARAQSMSPATDQAIRSYTLNPGKAEAILKTLKEVSAAVMKDPGWMTTIGSRMTLPFEEQWKAMESDPVSGPVLKANNLSAREYSCGLLAMRAASGLESGAGVAEYANPANVVFLKANPSVLERLRAIDSGK